MWHMRRLPEGQGPLRRPYVVLMAGGGALLLLVYYQWFGAVEALCDKFAAGTAAEPAEAKPAAAENPQRRSKAS